MKRQIHIDRILIFNDFPELFLAKDGIGSYYLCLLTHLSDEDCSYLCVSVSNDLLYQFVNGKRDLRSIFVEPELKEWWTTSDVSEPTISIDLYDLDSSLIDLLPEEGYYYTDELNHESIRQEVIDHDNVIVHLSLSDDLERQSIPIGDLGDFTKLYQYLVENAVKKAIQLSELKDKRSYIVPNNYTLHAFASSPGSFNLHMKSISSKDLFGNSIIEEGLQLIDKVITNPDNEELLVENLRFIKGHGINSYRKLLEKVINQKVTFKYKWISPTSSEIHKRSISSDYAAKVSEILSQKEELTEEVRIFIGYVMQADVEKGGWRIHNEEDQKYYSGESAGHLLEGITLETVKYKFTCQEVVEALKVTEKEKVKYILTSLGKVE